MTNLTYRGATHQRQQTLLARVAQALVYRGIPHDGRNSGAPEVSQNTAMRYRGVAHSLGQTAPRPGNAAAGGATSRLAPERAFA